MSFDTYQLKKKGWLSEYVKQLNKNDEKEKLDKISGFVSEIKSLEEKIRRGILSDLPKKYAKNLNELYDCLVGCFEHYIEFSAPYND